MSDEPENLVLRYLRQIDERLERLEQDVREIKARLSVVEHQMARTDRLLAELKADEQSHYAIIMSRFDGLERRVDRIERRLDLTEALPA